jgi:ATP-dependent DNA helicase RecG
VTGKKNLIKNILEEPGPETPYENQCVEWKESWRDEYIKWVCGFANARGGKLVVGKDDRGKVVGISGAKKLLVDIPNKIRDILGIIADVNLKREDGKEFIEIAVEPHPYPVNYRGEYHYRTGGTKQELKGPVLDAFLLKKYGLHWDGVPHPHLKIQNLEEAAFALFIKKGLQSGRLDDSARSETKEQLVGKLQLYDGSYLKRAAALLFSDDPEMFVTGAYVKIGFFRTDSDLLYQDEIHGNIFSQVDKTLDLLKTKYMKAYIHYEGVQRIDKFLFPPIALREAVTNAIVHKNYASANPIQISVYDEKIIIWNSASIPEELPIECLLGKHPSIPYNPLLATAFFRAGYIEAWGRGIEKIKTECQLADAMEPEIKYDFGGVMVTFVGEIPVSSEGGEKGGEKGREKGREKSREKSREKNHPESSQVTSGETTQKTPGETTQKTPGETTWKTLGKTTQKTPGEDYPENYRKTTQKIIEVLKNYPKISRMELAAIVGNITENGVKYHLEKMKRLRLIRRIGPDKGGKWEVVEKKDDN